MKRIIVICTVLCLAVAMAGCQAGTLKTRKVLPEWSRGQQVGVAALNQPIGLSAEGNDIHLIFVAAGDRGLQYVRISASGNIERSVNLAIDTSHPSYPQLFPAADGMLGLLWTDNPGIPRALFLARFNREGQLLSGPTRLSPENARVSDYALACNPDGNLDVFWNDEIPADGGIHHLRLATDGRVISDSRLLIPNAEKPTLQVNQDGVIHLAWIEEPTIRVNHIYYALFDPATGELSSKTKVGVYKTATGLVSYPPVLGLDRENGYLFWALEQRGGGLTPGEAKTYFVSFPLKEPREMEATILDIPGTARPLYQAASGSLPYQQLALAEMGWPTSLLYMPQVLNGQREELGVLLVGEVATQRKSSREVIWAIFADGKVKGYQVPTKLGNALRPVGTVDAEGNVHLVWLNAGGFGRYEVYYASTSARVKANLDRVTLQDRAMDFLNSVWGLAPAFGFFPAIFLLWSFASFVWIVLFYFIKVEGGLDRRPSQIALAVAILLYLFSKLFLMPGVLFYAPLLDKLPPNLHFLPVLGTPLFTLLAALGALWLYFRRSQYHTLFTAYLIFVLTDSLLSLMIYVPRWLEG
ncbi:MAG: hypothetical protein H5T63_04075 [Chloroflexi bacterium]|nr:hypothetical protein [Chloroflexota bacterium]